MSKIAIRKAERQDVPLLLEFIRGIARFGKMEDEVIASSGIGLEVSIRMPASKQTQPCSRLGAT